MDGMRLPQELAVAIPREVEKANERDWLRASEELTRRYKCANFGAAAIESDLDRAAYLLVRMPATYAAVQSVFAELQRLAPQDVVTSFLDLGAGPGTALFAAAQVFPTLHHALLIELSHACLPHGRNPRLVPFRTACRTNVATPPPQERDLRLRRRKVLLRNRR